MADEDEVELVWLGAAVAATFTGGGDAAYGLTAAGDIWCVWLSNVIRLAGGGWRAKVTPADKREVSDLKGNPNVFGVWVERAAAVLKMREVLLKSKAPAHHAPTCTCATKVVCAYGCPSNRGLPCPSKQEL